MKKSYYLLWSKLLVSVVVGVMGLQSIATAKYFVHVRNCCRKSKTFGIQGVSALILPCGKTAIIKHGKTHTFKILGADEIQGPPCYPGIKGRWNVTGGRSIIQAYSGSHVLAVSKKRQHGLRHCSTSVVSKDMFDQPC